jgi:hypothetical protein
LENTDLIHQSKLRIFLIIVRQFLSSVSLSWLTLEVWSTECLPRLSNRVAWLVGQCFCTRLLGAGCFDSNEADARGVVCVYTEAVCHVSLLHCMRWLIEVFACHLCFHGGSLKARPCHQGAPLKITPSVCP